MCKRLLLLFVMLSTLGLVSACATSGKEPDPHAHRVFKPGMTIQLNQTLSIPPQLARVYFQNGKIVRKLEVDQYRPSCNILSFKVIDSEQTIVPDSFEIVRVRNNSELLQKSYPMLASKKYIGIGVFDNGLSPMAEIFITLLEIRSSKNPDIKQLECLAWRKPHSNDYLTIPDIQQSLGDIMTLNL